MSEGPRIGIWIYLSACHPVGRCHGEHTNRSKLHHHGNYAVPRGYLSLLSTAVLSREVPAVQLLLFTTWKRFKSVFINLKLCTVQYSTIFNVHGSVHRNNILMYISNKMHMLQSLFYLTSALHDSGVNITHLQEHKTTVTIASGNRYTIIDRVKFVLLNSTYRLD